MFEAHRMSQNRGWDVKWGIDVGQYSFEGSENGSVMGKEVCIGSGSVVG